MNKIVVLLGSFSVFFITSTALAWNQDPGWVTPGWQMLAQGYVRSVSNFLPGDSDGSSEGFRIQTMNLIGGDCNEIMFHQGPPIQDLTSKMSVELAHKNASIAAVGGYLVNVFGIDDCTNGVAITVVYNY